MQRLFNIADSTLKHWPCFNVERTLKFQPYFNIDVGISFIQRWIKIQRWNIDQDSKLNLRWNFKQYFNV